MRQSIHPNPAQRLFEAYMDFSGGRNSETANERLRDNEFPILDNIDLGSRGSVKRRTGRKLLETISGTAQGAFFYYRAGQPKPDLILAVSGSLYVKENGTGTATPVTIQDGTGTLTFQATKSVEAVQYGDDLFIATGTKFCELTFTEADGWICKVVQPYTPTVMEVIYIGTNGLAANPDAYVQDGTADTLELAGIKPSTRSGVVHVTTTLTAYINKPQGYANTIKYKWEYRKSSETAWVVGQDISDTAKSWDFTPDTATDYDIRVSVFENTSTTATDQYVLTNYPVRPIPDQTENTSRPVTGIQTCRKIMLYWDRLILSGDDSHPYQTYISDLNAPRYFPTANTISFDTGKQEPITAIVRFRDMLIIFTKTTIQTLTGKSPEDYRRSLIHDGIGCIAPRSAEVTGNIVIFLSAEGIHMLKPNALTLEILNVQRIDYPIKSEVVQDADACALVYDSQYWLCFPSLKAIYRLYYDNTIWVRDFSSKLNFAQILHYETDIYEISQDGALYQQDRTLWTDAEEVYDVVAETKFLDLGASFNFKKLKRFYTLARHYHVNVGLKVTVQADSAVVLTPDQGEVVVNADGTTVWTTTTEPNLNFYAGTVVGSWVLGKAALGDILISVQKATIQGKCRRVKVRFTHSEATPCEIFGFGLEFKEKKP